MKIFIGADHNGYQLRRTLIEYLRRAGYDVVDEGDKDLNPEDDFPVFAQKVVTDMLGSDDDDPRGILLCGSGQGMCIAANRFKGIRAALGYNRLTVRASRNDDNANVLCLPANELAREEVNILAEAFLNTPFAAAPRYIRRLEEIDNYTG